MLNMWWMTVATAKPHDSMMIDEAQIIPTIMDFMSLSI